jgi:hypothetical protein
MTEHARDKDPGRLRRRLAREARRIERVCEFGRFPSQHSSEPTCVIGNALPKSGTYLLKAILQHVGKWHDPKVHLLDNHYFQFRDGRDSLSVPLPVTSALSRVRPGQQFAAHVHYSPTIASAISARPFIRHMYMYRDPRDTFVSYARFVADTEKSGHWDRIRQISNFMNTYLTNDADRLTYAIMRRLEQEDWLGYLGWCSDPNTYSIRFEELYPELVAAASGEFGPVLTGLLKFIGAEDALTDPCGFCRGVLGQGFTASGVYDKIAQYKRHFTDEHYRILDTRAFRSVLEAMGYEW